MTKPRVRLKADGNLIGISDSLVNITANLGTGRDKASHTTYAAPMVDDYTLMNAYRGGWLPRKIVDIPALDATRNWRNWQADTTEISAIEAEENRLGIRLKVKSAFTSARLMGGAAILIGTGDTDLAKPLDPARIGLGGLKYATVLHKRHLYASEIENDPASPFFGKPAMWTLNPGGMTPAQIHASRLVILSGADVVDPGMTNAVYGWGDSVLLAMFEAIRNMDATSANVASLVFEAKVDTVGIPDFMRKLGDANYSAQMLKRWSLAETGKGINGTFMHDAEEIIGQKTASFSGLPDLMDRFMTIVAGAADIPLTRLLGQSPGGLNASGEGDARNYYDRIRAMQELDLGPAMHILDECLIRSALGSRPDDVYYNWASLWQISDKERADIGKTQADTVAALFNTGIIDQDALADAAVNMLTESGAMPGLEGYVAQYAGNEGGEDDVILVDFDPNQPRSSNGRWSSSGGGNSASGHTSLGDFDAESGRLSGAALVTSQDFLDDDIVQAKIESEDFSVFLSPEFEAGGERIRVVLDGHHSLAAAVKSGNIPDFTEYTSSDHDAIGLLNSGDTEGFLEAVNMGADYRNAVTGKDIW